jgi:hypothetical protein
MLTQKTAASTAVSGLEYLVIVMLLFEKASSAPPAHTRAASGTRSAIGAPAQCDE